MTVMAVSHSAKMAMVYFGAALAVIVMIQMVKFVSYLPAEQATPSADEQTGIAWLVLHNISLVCLFMFLHSALADTSVKNFFEKCGIQDLQRNIYVIASCVALQVLFYSWHPIPWLVLWNFNISDNRWLWWMYTILHVYVWVLVYVGNLMLDIPELLGIKQVVYSNRDLQSPELYKSPSLQRLRKTMNHTSFLGFSILFWVYPYMRLDRAVFAILLQLYMIINWKPDEHDVQYVKQQFQNKKLKLK